MAFLVTESRDHLSERHEGLVDFNSFAKGFCVRCFVSVGMRLPLTASEVNELQFADDL
jgi:hypothetical protein